MLGKNIKALRKSKGLSQEELAVKLNVVRQTISKWEKGETSPDLKQAKVLSQVFKVSLDELVDNDIKNIIIEKITNTEKLAGMIINILKALGTFFLIYLIIMIIIFIIFSF